MLARQRQEAILREVDRSGGARVSERVAAGLISPGASIAISAGTTTYAVAHELLNVPNLTVVTNSPRVADLLHNPQRDDLTVVLTGGVRTPSDALAGPVADATLRSLHVDTLILGVHGNRALIVAQPFDDEEDNGPRTVESP